MRVVVDANVVAAALLRPGGWFGTQLEREDVEWFAPEFLWEELMEHHRDFAADAEVTFGTMKRRIEALTHVWRVDMSELAKVRDDPRVLRAYQVDPDDWPCLAALVAVDADHLWTQDSAILDAFPGLAVTAVPPTIRGPVEQGVAECPP
jgi:predicted nucleic acid-binding protein